SASEVTICLDTTVPTASSDESFASERICPTPCLCSTWYPISGAGVGGFALFQLRDQFDDRGVRSHRLDEDDVHTVQHHFVRTVPLVATPHEVLLICFVLLSTCDWT